ncbi:MAG: putative alkyl/aryl-sulfatase YjcS [Myxococcota bacterium]|nr:putative alkyl/aryl-sulfatase YjcS [Myxococcota bacterium]
MGDVRRLAGQLWNGEITTAEQHPLLTFAGLEEYADGVAFISSMANVTAIRAGDGLLLADAGGPIAAQAVREQLRAWSREPVHTLIYTHGHVDHVAGAPLFREENAGREWMVIAHAAVSERFERYRRTAGLNAAINQRQFRAPGLTWDFDFVHPGQVYHHELEFQCGGVDFHLHHSRGETDDHTWIWVPLHKLILTGDLFIWASPNCGNPQKVQRYPREWAQALREMESRKAELLFPGHGVPIEGAARVSQALLETAELLESLHDQTLRLMNEGAPLDVVLREVRAPERLLQRPYLRPVYDEPEFIVRNTWRLYGGWWDGNPARLKPPRDAALSREVAELTGGASRLADRARKLADENELAMACQLIEWAAAAAPDDTAIRELRREIYTRRALAEQSLMARSIFLGAADE